MSTYRMGRRVEHLPRPSSEDLIPSQTIHPRHTLAPLEPPPVQIEDYPSIGVKRQSEFEPGYTVSTHVFPAAYPRCKSEKWVPPPAYESKQEKKDRIQERVRRFAALKEAQERGEDTRPDRGEVHWMVAKRYVRDACSTKPGLTLVLSHCIGAHKEVRPVVS